MTKEIAYLLVFDGFADWEAALASSEIRKQDHFKVKMIGFTEEPVTSMGGLTIMSDLVLEQMDSQETTLLILPGDDRWERCEDEAFARLLGRWHEAGVPIPAICGGTLAVARARLLQNRRHTSNAQEYLTGLVSQYGGENNYIDELAVTDGTLITASGVGSVEFCREVMALLYIYTAEEREAWFDLYRHGVWRGTMPGEAAA